MSDAHSAAEHTTKRASHQKAMANPHDAHVAPSRLPWWAQALGLGVFVFLVLAAGIFAVGGHWRRATFMLGASMIWLAALRGTCDDRVIGLFSVRSRRFDITFSLLIGGLMMYLAFSIDALGS